MTLAPHLAAAGAVGGEAHALANLRGRGWRGGDRMESNQGCLRLLAYLETNPDTHIHNHIHKCIAILAVLHLSLNELSSLVLLVSFVARRDAAHGQHYGSTIWKSGVG